MNNTGSIPTPSLRLASACKALLQTLVALACCLTLLSTRAAETNQSTEGNSKARSGNPIFPGWYADPEGVVFGNNYWVYPTYSAAYDQQVFLDAFSSPDL